MVLSQYIATMPLFPNEKIRDTLYNIEQFKFDANLQPEIKMGLSSSSISSNNSNSSTKSGSSLQAASGNSSSNDKEKGKLA